MEVVISVLLGLVLLVSILWGLIIYQQNKKTQKNPMNVEFLQKDIISSKELLELQVKNLKEQLEQQKIQLYNIIEGFQKDWNGSDKEKTEKLSKLITQIDNFHNSLNKKENDYKQNADVIRNQVTTVISDLAKLKESSNVLGKINDNIQSLQEVFINTKKRGNIGEYLLEKILTNMLGSNSKLWQRQYQTNDGKIVDAYIKTSEEKEGIAIDSKFAFDNYKKYLASEDGKIKETHLKTFRSDIRKQVDEVSKYISAKNNISSAIMFIPSEEVFTFIYGHFAEEIVDYAFKKKVWITSPTTLAAILHTVEKNNEVLEFNKDFEAIASKIIAFKTDFDRWVERWEKVKNGFKKTSETIDTLDKTHEKMAGHYRNLLERSQEIKESE